MMFSASFKAKVSQYLHVHKWGLAITLAAWFIFFAPIILGQSLYYLDDLKIFYYPLESVYAEFQHNWQLPYWSPYFGFGQPLIAWGQLGFFTPLHVLLRAFYIPALPLLQISVVSYFLVGALGMYSFLTARKLKPLSATLGATLFMLCGFSIGHLNHVNFYTTTMVMPWLFLAINFFAQKPTLKRAGGMSIIAAIMAMSGQPQIALYSLIISSILGLCLAISHMKAQAENKKKYIAYLLALTAMAAILWVLISSLAILPLQEFLPQTERADALSQEELFDFSYPPYNGISLVLPYFFGDHDTYWGPKGFQELAGYVGFIPLFLSGIALAGAAKKYRPEKLSAIILIIISIIIGLGRFSFIYTYLVENHWITSLANAGRFIFFFDIGILLLAAIGLEKIWNWADTSRGQRVAMLTGGFLLPALCLAPFFVQLQFDARVYKQFIAIFTLWPAQAVIAVAGIAILVLTSVLLSTKKYHRFVAPLLVGTSCLTLLIYSWNFNPRTTWDKAKEPAFATPLENVEKQTSLPARLYARPDLLRDSDVLLTKRSDQISRDFSVLQPIHITQPDFSCITLEVILDEKISGSFNVSILQNATDTTPLRELSMRTDDLPPTSDVPFCFAPIHDSQNKTYVISITSEVPSGLYLSYHSADPSPDNVSFIRKTKPTTEQIRESQKPGRLVMKPVYQTTTDSETVILERHINVIAHTSSARWIGALSIRWYRQFIESFFANDADSPVDGDGIHAIVRNRKIVDASGINYLGQLLPQGSEDTMEQNNFPTAGSVQTDSYTARLYTNPTAYPKAFLVPSGIWKSADDETRFGMMQPDFDPKVTAFINGPTPPTSLPTQKTVGSHGVTITSYKPTQVDIQVTTPQEALLILNDVSTPQWQTFIDGMPSLQLKADSVFRAAIVPAGSHTVSFRYYSPATEYAKKATFAGLIITLVIFLPYGRFKSLLSSSVAKPVGTR